MGKPNFQDKCYKTKEDKSKTTIFSCGDPSKETAEEREIRIKNLRESAGKWVWDEGKLVRAEEYYAKKETDLPKVINWNPEWTWLATGKRMGKAELKRYCRERGKIWVE